MRIKGLVFCFHVIAYYLSQNRNLFNQDVDRWAKDHGASINSSRGRLKFIVSTLSRDMGFRSVFYHRIPMSRVLSFYAPGAPALYLIGEIGPGLYIQHGFATIVIARRIGSGFRVNQQVTVGYNGPDRYPTIGNNVVIRSGAKVFGQITIGDNVIIGANAVVSKDVPSNCVVAGVPARIIKRDGIRVDEPL